MSKRGLKMLAAILSDMQQARIKLIGMGTKGPITKGKKQDIRLGQLLKTGKDAMKEEFINITLEV